MPSGASGLGMPILFDSSVYIAALRQGGASTVLLLRWAQESPLWLSSVVLEELYAGANPQIDEFWRSWNEILREQTAFWFQI